MEQLETYKQEQRRVNFQQNNTTKRDRERLAGSTASFNGKETGGEIGRSKDTGRTRRKLGKNVERGTESCGEVDRNFPQPFNQLDVRRGKQSIKKEKSCALGVGVSPTEATVICLSIHPLSL